MVVSVDVPWFDDATTLCRIVVQLLSAKLVLR
jgi:hypothetical protein